MFVLQFQNIEKEERRRKGLNKILRENLAAFLRFSNTGSSREYSEKFMILKLSKNIRKTLSIDLSSVIVVILTCHLQKISFIYGFMNNFYYKKKDWLFLKYEYPHTANDIHLFKQKCLWLNIKGREIIF